jgi:hypothetical protein
MALRELGAERSTNCAAGTYDENTHPLLLSVADAAMPMSCLRPRDIACITPSL